MLYIGQIKGEARSSLSKGNLVRAIIIMIIIVLINSLPQVSHYILEKIFTSEISMVNSSGVNITLELYNILFNTINYLVSSGITLGACKWYYNLTENHSQNITTIFYPFTGIKKFIRCLSVSIIKLLLSFGYIGLISILWLVMLNPFFDLTITFISVLIMLLIIISYVFLCLNFFLLPYLVVSNENKSIVECIKESWIKVKAHRFSIIRLYLSFILWILSCLLIIPIFFVVPYYIASRAVAAKKIIQLESETKEQN